MTTTPTITTKPGGWHEAIVRVHSNASGTTNTWRVKWRTQRKASCCAFCKARTLAGDSLPVDTYPNDWGEPQTITWQCSTYGTLGGWDYTAERLNKPSLAELGYGTVHIG